MKNPKWLLGFAFFIFVFVFMGKSAPAKNEFVTATPAIKRLELKATSDLTFSESQVVLKADGRIFMKDKLCRTSDEQVKALVLAIRTFAVMRF